ncbi:MAG: hypothetical protein FJ100_01530 [Deltaproteobacteria bacterium]|nr:hypothetical protein [Deltaproteobacteria bacterium]
MTAVAALLRAWRWPLLALAVVLTSLAVRATVEQRAAYARAVAFEHAGDLWRAVDEYRWALRWYTPWGPDHGDAAEALRDLGERHAKDDPELAVQALDNLRSGLYAGRSLWLPRAELVALCNERLPPLLVRVAERRGDPRALGAGRPALLAQFQAAYARPVGVGPWVSLAVSLGFLLWVAGIVFAVRRGVDDDGRFLATGWRWLGASAAGFVTWALAMWLG